MADGFVGVAVDGAGKKIDVTELTVGANVVERQRVQIGGTGATDLATVSTSGELIVSFKDLLPAAQTVTAQDIASTSVVGANNQSIVTGTPTAGSMAAVAVSGDSSFSIQISGTWTGTLAFERSLDGGTTYTPIGAFSAGTSFITPTVTQNGAFHGNAASATNIRARATTAWTGTASVKLLAGAGGSTITVGNPLRLFDKVSGVEHSIKAASTAAVATDTALVVTVHPSTATQPVSLATNTPTIAAGAAVIGKVGIDQTTPGTSNAVSVTNTSFAVTQATAASLNATVVGTGTFAVQAAATLAAETTKVIGTVNLSANQTVAAVTAITNALPTGTNTLGSIKVTDGTTVGTLKAASTASVATDTALVVALSPNSPVQQAAITKGTQGTTGVTTQDLKDSGRVSVIVTCYRAAGIITTEGLFAAATFSQTRDAATPTTGQQFTITAGKRFRIQAVECSLFGNAAAAVTSKIALRAAPAAGVISNTSAIIGLWDIGSNNTATGNYIGPTFLDIPDGLELLPGYAYGFTNLSNAATVLHTIALIGYEY